MATSSDQVAVAPPVEIDAALNAAALDLRRLVAALSRSRGRNHDWWKDARALCGDLAERFSRLRDDMRGRWESRGDGLSLEQIGAALQRYAGEIGECSRPRLREVRASLARAYEDLVVELRAMRRDAAAAQAADGLHALRLPRPARSALHVGIGIVCVLLYELVLSHRQAMISLFTAATVFATLEITRRLSRRWNDFLVDQVFGMISRPRERYRTNSATYYLAALTLITLFASRAGACLSVLVLAFGDPAASIVGHRFGKWRFRNGKSLVGCAAFLVAAVVAGSLYLALAYPALPLATRLGAVGTLALVGTVTEVLAGGKVDDNFAIPVACALASLPWL